MTVVLIDGFDHYASGTYDTIKFPTGDLTISPDGARAGSKCAYNSYLYAVLSASADTIVVGFRYKGTGQSNLVQVANTNGIQCTIKAYSDGTLEILNGASNGTQLEITGPSAFPLNTWVYIQAKILIGNSGSWEVRVGKTTVLQGTGDTQNQATTGATKVHVECLSAYVDDYYLAVDDDFKGDCRVDMLPPSSVGTYSEWTPNPTADNYTNVDDDGTIDGDSTINAASTNGKRDSYGHGTLPVKNTDIIAVAKSPVVRRSDAGSTRTIRSFLRIGGTNYFGASQTINNDSYTCKQTIWEDNPAGGSFSEAIINGMETGIELES